MKNRKLLAFFTFFACILLVLVGVGAVSGASFTTFNPEVDGDGKEVCKNSIINCNIYGAKEYVWLNGGPLANGLGPDGEYFFAVLEPGGQPNPKDQGAVPDKNLSDDYDCYQNRIFTVTDGEVSAYAGNYDCSSEGYSDYTPFKHWFDSGADYAPCNKNGNGPNPCPDRPDDLPPFIRLFPYSDTTNPGGVYILAICSLAEGYQGIDPRDCKYDAFKVKEGRVTYDFYLEGYKIHDRDANGVLTDTVDVGLENWEITIVGTGFLGESIHVTVTTNISGYWYYQSQEYVFNGQDKPQTAHLTICEIIPADSDWVQSYPASGCHEISIDPQGVTYVSKLDFGNYLPIDITVCKFTDDYDAATPAVPYVGWEVWLYKDDVLFDSPQYTGSDGCHTWQDLDPGHSYAVEETDPLPWVPTSPAYVDFGYLLSGDGPLTHTWTNVPAQGCTPGFWQGGPDKPDAKAGGALLWDGDDVAPWGDVILPPPHVDAQWTASGGAGGNPYIHTTDFYSFFGDGYYPGAYTMFELVDTGGGSENWRKAARSLVAAYLNASWGMNYAYTTAELTAMWNAANTDAKLLELHTLLDAANNHFDNPDGDCPISASGW